MVAFGKLKGMVIPFYSQWKSGLIRTVAFGKLTVQWFPILQMKNLSYHGFQYFSSVPVLHYLQAVLFIKKNSWISINATLFFKVGKSYW
jgi:hypothetical protein